ncbi:MAG: hypothetical protein Q4F88_02195 [Eubacteriales bacterium]|nr:hypothetical protein [Eubacteriales bacterium]
MLYIDPDILLPDNLPKGLKEDISNLEKYYNENNENEYWLQLDVVEFNTKAYQINGKISKNDLQLIFRKYGFA